MIEDMLHHPCNVGVLASFLKPKQVSFTSDKKFQGMDLKIVDQTTWIIYFIKDREGNLWASFIRYQNVHLLNDFATIFHGAEYQQVFFFPQVVKELSLASTAFNLAI